MRVAAILFCLALVNCAGSDAHLRMLESGNALSVAPGTTEGEYVVTLRNVKDVGYDPDDPVTRRTTAEKALAAQCGGPARVIGESVINTGTYALGNAARTYSVRVRCA